MVKVWPGKGGAAYKSFFERVLKQWEKNILSYSKKTNGEDQLYWYNENATVSTLAQAISIKGSNVHLLQDFRISKKVKLQKKRSKSLKKTRTVKGRADLWFECDNLKYGYLIEAKPSWPTLKRLDADAYFQKVKNSFVKNFKKAKNDVKSCRSSLKKMNCCGMAMVFIAPKIRRDDLENAKPILESLKENLSKMDGDEFGEICLFASVFPEEGDMTINDDGDFVFPGVILLGAEILEPS